MGWPRTHDAGLLDALQGSQGRGGLGVLAEDDALDTIRSVLQYCRSLKAAISACGHFVR